MSTRFRTQLFRGLAFVLALAIGFASLSLAGAARPAGDRLLPISTVAFLRIADVPNLVSKFQETSTGRIAREQQFRPLLAQLFDSASEEFKPAEDRIGLSLSELLSLPQGELTLAIVEPEEGPPAGAMLMDVGAQETKMRTLLDRIGVELEEAGGSRSTETVGGTELTIFEMRGGPRSRLVYALKKATLLATNDVQVAKGLLARWGGDQAQPSLSENGDFADAMSHARGSRSAKPHIDWFVDPIGFFKAVARGNVGAQAGLAVLPVLGLDGLRGVGGSITFATEQYDTLLHLHVLLEEPRTGILAMLAFGQGDTTPEAWVPHDAATYWTGYWDAQKTFEELTKLYDSFRGEGAMEAEIKRRVSAETGIDFRKDVLEAIAGRFTRLTWFEPPARLRSQAWLVGIRLEDAKAFRGTFDKMTTRFAPNLTPQTYGSTKYYLASPQSPDGDPGDGTGAEGATPERPIRPCIAIVGEYLLIADRPALLERAITTQSDASKSLASELDFKLIASKLLRQSRATPPCLLTFQRPEEGMRLLYELATGEESRRRLADAGENNRFFATLNKSLEDNPLPPFAVLKRYLAPGGGILTNDSSGLHYTGFGLRRK